MTPEHVRLSSLTLAALDCILSCSGYFCALHDQCGECPTGAWLPATSGQAWTRKLHDFSTIGALQLSVMVSCKWRWFRYECFHSRPPLGGKRGAAWSKHNCHILPFSHLQSAVPPAPLPGANPGPVSSCAKMSSDARSQSVDRAHASAPSATAATAVSQIPSIPRDASMRASFEAMIREAQDSICSAVEKVEGKAFHEDSWTRPDGGGGTTRVLSGGAIWEKAGVNVSVVHGAMPLSAYRAARSHGIDENDPTVPKHVPFFAAGISSVMHPRNPHAPTMHFNYRYFEAEAVGSLPAQWWFGGGTDITPSYVVPEDLRHFHGTLKEACDKHDPEFFPRFKAWCDDYFVIQHRNERRGLGGIFFDDLADRDPEQLLAFAKDCAAAVVPAYLPLVIKHKDDPFTIQQKTWQQTRRGRYVEFNLVYDRGTTFGLKAGGRIESILMSLPETATWLYNHQPEEGSPEAELLKYTTNPVGWV